MCVDLQCNNEVQLMEVLFGFSSTIFVKLHQFILDSFSFFFLCEIVSLQFQMIKFWLIHFFVG